MRHLLIRRFAAFVLVASLALIVSYVSTAQNQAGFTVDDMLDVVNYGAADVSDDGRWVAATGATLRDRIGIDNTRFGDPSYIAPSNAEVLVIDTQTGRTRKLFSDKRQVRQLKWSADGSRLAMLVLKGEVFEPVIWERSSGNLQTIKLPQSKSAAENSDLMWTPSGDKLADRAASR
ncbi:MAG: hypothetical protein IPL01_09960 [Acidobacteria bacterium]|nr:hypothetical protein [Acidobacteriota bacterium]